MHDLCIYFIPHNIYMVLVAATLGPLQPWAGTPPPMDSHTQIFSCMSSCSFCSGIRIAMCVLRYRAITSSVHVFGFFCFFAVTQVSMYLCAEQTNSNAFSIFWLFWRVREGKVGRGSKQSVLICVRYSHSLAQRDRVARSSTIRQRAPRRRM